MAPENKTKPPAPPDCPREYHDDYVGRPARKTRATIVLVGAGIVLTGCAVVFALSHGGIG